MASDPASDESPAAPSEVTTGWYSALSHPLVYEAVQYLVGARRGQRILIERHIRPKPNESLLDIGCGPAQILKLLPDVRYVGIDHNPSYIARARRTFGDRGSFYVGDIGGETLRGIGHFDIAVAMGVLHHIDDEAARSMLTAAFAALRPGGRLMTADPCFYAGQNPLTRFAYSKDRGQHVRQLGAYLTLVKTVFSNAQYHLVKSLFPFPHSICVIEASRS